jgi:hypothetical protein
MPPTGRVRAERRTWRRRDLSASSRNACVAVENPLYCFDELGCALGEAIAEQIGALDGRKRTTDADIEIRDITGIQPDRD